MKPLEKARLCLEFIQERKAIDPILMEVGRLTSFTDYFLVASGNSSRQVQAISQHMARRLREEGFRPLGVEGEQEGHWVLMDYGDVEGLWTEAPRVDDESKNKKA
jgi:ribosome-associated protein